MRISTVNIEFIGRQLKFWKSYKVSDSYAIKLLKLWLGYETRDLMDELGRYPAQNFNELRRRLNFVSTQKLLEQLQLCHSFYASGVKTDAGIQICYVFSPVWHHYEEADGELLFGAEKSQDFSQDFDANITEIIYNHTTVGNAEAFSPGGEGGRLEGSGEGLKMPDNKKVRQGIVRDYFKWMETMGDGAHKALIADLKNRICNPRNKKGKIVEELKLPAQQGDEVYRILTNRVLTDYLSRRDSFFRDDYLAHPEKRIYWMTRLMQGYGFGFLKNARNLWERQHVDIEAAAASKVQEAERKYKPVSEFEWMDADGTRWFEDRLGKALTIPADAPPRPSITSTYIQFKKEWREMNQNAATASV